MRSGMGTFFWMILRTMLRLLAAWPAWAATALPESQSRELGRIIEFHDGFHSPSWTKPESASDSFHVGNNPPLQTHFILDKASI